MVLPDATLAYMRTPPDLRSRLRARERPIRVAIVQL
jgi:hypothetical protein